STTATSSSPPAPEAAARPPCCCCRARWRSRRRCPEGATAGGGQARATPRDATVTCAILPPVPARDFYHDHVVDALIRDGWTITHDPLMVRVGAKDVFIDLGAERFLGAEKEGRKIAVEVKSFIGRSETHELEVTLGQFVLYGAVLDNVEP